MSLEQLREKHRLRHAFYYANPRNKFDPLPLRWGVYSSCTEEKFTGFPIVCIDTVNYKYLAFDGEGTTVGSIRVWDKDGALVNGANYSYDVAEVDENGDTKAIITFTGDMSASEPLTAEVNGRKCTPGYLDSQTSDYLPIAIYDFFINVCGFTLANVIDRTSWYELLALCKQYEYKCRIHVTDDLSPLDLLKMVCPAFNIDWWVSKEKVVKFKVHPPTLSYRIAFATSDYKLQPNSLQVRSQLDDVVNQVAAKYGYCNSGFVFGDDGSTYIDLPSQQWFGTRSIDHDMRYLGAAGEEATFLTAVANIQQSIVERFKDPVVIEFDTIERKFFFMERFDCFAMSHDHLYDTDLTQLRNGVYQILYIKKSATRLGIHVVALRLKGAYKYWSWFLGGNPVPGGTQGYVLLDGSRRLGGDPDPTKY